ncbi:hypothetical protein HDV01_000231 [Terramyces sp. JEL0728]|nr:hypothetical protein HDV01_000231 [Terramyces sp. JEL0728]
MNPEDRLLNAVKYYIQSIGHPKPFPDLENVPSIGQSVFTFDTVCIEVGEQIVISNESRHMLTLDIFGFLDMMQHCGRFGSTPLSIFLSFGDESFCYTPICSTSFMVELMYEGYLPIFQGGLIPKLHAERCLMIPDLHIPKKAYKNRKKYKLTINTDFDGVVSGVDEQHHSWFKKSVYKGLVGYQHPYFKFYSIELWKNDELVAGDLGYTVGSVYTSMTGFYREDGAGTVLLTAIKRMLVKGGLVLWDLGMGMKYKMAMGAKLYSRAMFLAHLRRNRKDVKHLQTDSLEQLFAKM